VVAARRNLPGAVGHTVAGPLHTAAHLAEDRDRTAAHLAEERRTGLAEVRHIGLLVGELRIGLQAVEHRTALVVAVRSLVALRTEAVDHSHRLGDLVAFARRS
jgi:hypothetical protein